MLVLRTSNFQGATIRPIVPRHKHYCLSCSPLNFLPRASSNIIANYLQNFLQERRESQMQSLEKKRDKLCLQFFFPISPLVHRIIFKEEFYPSGYFLRNGITRSISVPMNTMKSRD